MTFLDERFPIEISYGSRGGPAYNTSVESNLGGFENRNANWINTRRRYNAAYGVRDIVDLESVMALFHIAQGRAHGFRYRDWNDYKSTGTSGTPSNTDQSIGTGDGATVAFQITKLYQFGSSSITQNVSKPVTGTVLAAIGGTTDTAWSVGATGLLTFSADISGTITAITQAAAAQITVVGHGLSNGLTVYMAGVVGMTEINGLRGTVTVVDVDNFTVDINSTGFTPYVSDGTINTIPQTGEDVTCGYEFDVPVRFDSDQLDISHDDVLVGSAQIPMVEIRL